MAKIVREIDWGRVHAELEGSIREAREENITLIHYNSDTEEAWRITPDGKIEPYELVDQTDWERVNAMTEEEIEAAIASDPDEPGDDWLDHAIVVRVNGKEVANGK